MQTGKDHDMVMMICTAGHVDHGKTSLVKQLTGCETDRLKVEKERGLTIELGFAPCMLKGDISVGIVDVPGHEKFIKNMVSGIPGIDLAVLVIAADDGIMPQTVEHFQIMELLGVRSGIVALTKIDLVSDDRVQMLIKDINSFLMGTFMENAPICPVSSETFEGFFDFYDVLVDQVKKAQRKRATGIFRVPIERTFTQEGFGTIVSGIPLDGFISTGSQVEIVPGNHKGKIRGIQVFGKKADRGGLGQCLALNIPDFGKHEPERGQVLCIPGYLKGARYFHIRLKTVPGMDRPLKNAEEIKFHTGTSEEQGKLFLLEEGVLGSSQTAIASVALQNQIAASTLDRFIIRRISPAATVAGGEILGVSYTERRPRKKRIVERLNRYQAFFQDVDIVSSEGTAKKIEYFLCTEKREGASLKEISIGTLLPTETVKDSLVGLIEGNKVDTPADSGSVGSVDGTPGKTGFFFHTDAYSSCFEEVEDWIRAGLAEEEALSLTVSDLRKAFEWPNILWNKIIDDLNKGDLVNVQGNKLIMKGAASWFSEDEHRIVEALLKVYKETGFKSPRPEELPEKVGGSKEEVDRLLEHLCNEGTLVRLTKNVILSYSSFKAAQDKVVELIKENGSVNSADFKYRIDSTRKYALAILDFLDARRVTVCLQNHDRKFAPDYERNLL